MYLEEIGCGLDLIGPTSLLRLRLQSSLLVIARHFDGK